MIKVLVVDDHPAIRRGLKEIIAEVPDMVVAGEEDRGRKVLAQVHENDYDVVMLEISLPDQNGLDVLKQLQAEKPQLAVLILSIHSEEQYALRTLKAGASGYLTKDSAPEEIVAAIRKVARGERYVTATFAEKLAANYAYDAKWLQHELLSDREYQVMCMVANGKPDAEIAEKLSLSVFTVSAYRSRALKKMNLKSRVQLTRYAIDHGLME